jgi:hypothetical protein
MKSFLSLTCLLLSFQALAGLKVKIVDIIEEEEFLLLANNGLVYELTTDDREVLDFAHYAKENDLEVEIVQSLLNLDSVFDNRESVRTLKLDYTPDAQVAPKNINKSILNVPTPLDNYEVSNVSESQADSLFSTMRRDTRRKSQCYNRAHIWSYELSQKSVNGSKLNLGKTWIFFTRKYIQEYKYKWWFHVAPHIMVDSSHSVLDRKFLRGPISLQGWTNYFMQNKAVCKVVEYYDDYSNNQDVESCFIMKSSMYYWQPLHIEGLEDGDAEPKSWNSQQMNIAGKNAIGRRWKDD